MPIEYKPIGGLRLAMKVQISLSILFSFCLVVCLLPVSLLAQTDGYKIGPEDVLEVKFWQEKELNSTVRVNIDGKISLDIVGTLDVAGKTVEELENLIVRQMSRLNRNVSQVVVRVVAYNYQAVFVTGLVTTPGKKTFEVIPDLWTIINEAGGVAETGDLTRVTIIRGGEDAGQVEQVNVSKAIAEGKLNKLPKIRRLDTIEIPRTPGGLPSANLGAQVEQRNIIYAIGAVNIPGEKQFEENIDVIEALAKAGGPAANADLKRVQIITKDGPYAQSLKFDLEKYSKTGTPARYIMRKEDTFVVPEKKSGFLGLGTASTILGLLTSSLVIYTTVREIQN